jgi:uncharacterized protein YjbI with pentapeptide repeats
MKVFIGWSGETGRAIAEAVHRWLPGVIQGAKTYLSPEDVVQDERWGRELAKQLESSDVGVLVITQDTVQAPWIMFEAGVLSKQIGKGKVAPILFGLGPAEVEGPLVQFQAATFQKAEMQRVVRMINGELGDAALPRDLLESAFETWWPLLEEEVEALLAAAGGQGSVPRRSEREILEEVLALTRSLAQGAVRRRDTTDGGYLPRGRVRPRTTARNREAQLSQQEVKSRMKAGGGLAGANLMDVNLTGLDLSGANLRGANLVGANLSQSKLINADLTGANLERATLLGADLKGANISRTNLWRAVMTGVQHLKSVVSMEFANFYDVQGLSVEDREVVSERNTVSLGDYGAFFAFYEAQGMTRSELDALFLWTAHPHFASLLLR